MLDHIAVINHIILKSFVQIGHEKRIVSVWRLLGMKERLEPSGPDHVSHDILCCRIKELCHLSHSSLMRHLTEQTDEPIKLILGCINVRKTLKCLKVMTFPIYGKFFFRRWA